MRILTLLFLTLLNLSAWAQQTPFERSNRKETATYNGAILFYQNLAKTYLQAKLLTYGSTDFGKPLHLLVLSKYKIFDVATLKRTKKTIWLINNGIHPGEPEGVDASMLFARNLLKENKLPNDVVICIIPMYNVDGSNNRSSTSRANQNGPLAYGFRGNAKNLDLNRDFIKSDTKNSLAFQQIFNTWQPEIFVDNHTSNGADYQYTMTLIATQKDKLNPIVSGYLTQTLLPDLYADMKTNGNEMIPYVNGINETPDAGITGFIESPRYSTGYTALHNTIGFMPETHMLKDFDKRVDATYFLLNSFVKIIARDAKLIYQNKRKADAFTAQQKNFPLDWKMNRNTYDSIEFKGYAAKQKPSLVSGLDRLYYDRNEPYTKKIKLFNNFEPRISVNKPIAYVIPKAWDKVIALLKLNNVKMQQLATDAKLDLDMYYIDDMKTASKPYEGHYLHNAIKLSTESQNVQFYAGDYVVYTNQAQNRYIIETLEPQAIDSFFNWNFFDSVLMRKEYFSAYVFEDTAAELLKNNPQLKEKLAQEKIKNPAMVNDADAQLDFIYRNSPHSEKTFMRYPVGRLQNNVKLNLK